jgi:outer membrane autotransporter protein
MSSAWAGSLNHSGSLASEGFSQASLSLGGTVVGFDQALGDEALVGLSLSKARLDAGLSGLGGESRALIDEAALYAGWSREGRYVHGRLAQGRINQQMQRRVLLGTTLSGVATQYRAHYSSLGVEAGSHHDWAGMDINPFVSSQWVSLSQDGFGEAGAYGFGLRAGDLEHRFWQAGAGLDVSREWFRADGGSHRVAARLQWQRALRGADAGVEASFVGLDAFAPVHGVGLPRERVLLDVGLESKLTPRSTLGFGLQREFSGRDTGPRLSATFNTTF